MEIDDEKKVSSKIFYTKLNEWTKKNIFTVIGIIIILLVVWYDVVTVQTQKIEVVKKCNDHWQNQIKQYCPFLYENGVVYNLTADMDSFSKD